MQCGRLFLDLLVQEGAVQFGGIEAQQGVAAGGKIEGIERALEADAACAEVLRQIASVRGAVSGLTAEVMEDHLREHVLAVSTDEARRQGGEEMIEVIRTYMK